MKNIISRLSTVLILSWVQLAIAADETLAPDTNTKALLEMRSQLFEKGADEDITRLVATFPITTPMAMHQSLFQELLGDKSLADRKALTTIADSVVDGEIHPYAYYQLLILASSFKDHAKAQEAFDSVPPDEIVSPYRIAAFLGLSRVLDEGRLVLPGVTAEAVDSMRGGENGA